MFKRVFKNFSFIQIEPNFLVNEEYLKALERTLFLEKVKDWDNLERFFPLIFSHQKTYRKVKAIQIDSLQIYIKRYKANLKEAFQEWKNILFLWSKGYPTSFPIFYIKDKKFALIGTKKIEGISFIDYLNSEKVNFFIEKIATYLGNLHKEKIFHQDCYLNHFYLDEKEDILYMIDVSRVLYNPLLKFYYQIKDLSQLKFSFSFYFKDNWKILWESFMIKYENTIGYSLINLHKFLLEFKFKKIKSHTQKLLKKVK